MATDLPEPVVPATSRCGILASSAMIGFAADGLAEAERQLEAALDLSKVLSDSIDLAEG